MTACKNQVTKSLFNFFKWFDSKKKGGQSPCIFTRLIEIYFISLRILNNQKMIFCSQQTDTIPLT